jgi:integrase
MKANSFRVKDGNRSLMVWKHAKGWRFGIKTPEGWRYVTRTKKADAKKAAEEALAEVGGAVAWSLLKHEEKAFLGRVLGMVRNEGDRRAVVDFLEARSQSCALGPAVERFLSAKILRAGEETPYLRDLRSRMEGMAEALAGKLIAEISFDELRAWVAKRTAGKSVKFYIDVRSNVIEFWKWARIEGLTDGQSVTIAERLPAAKREKGGLRVATVEEVVRLLNEVGEEWRPWVVLGAFAGLRPEEVAPKPTRKKKHKRGLACEDIDWRFGVIRVPADVSKVERPRVIPMGDTLKGALVWAGIEEGMSGPVVLRNPTEAKETGRLGKLVFGSAWPKDVLRHSFGSYRNAVLRNLAQVAEEMGTSEKMLHAHYHNPRAEAEGLAWFGLVAPTSSVKKWRVPSDEQEIDRQANA